MKTSINAWAVDGALGFEEMFRTVKSYGFDGIELNLDEGGTHALTMTTTDETLDEIKNISKKYELPIVSISSSMYQSKLGSNDSAVREEAKSFVLRQVYLAKKLGATGVLIVPGGMSDDVSLLQSWNNSLTALKELKPLIKDCGIKINVENVWNGFFTSPFDMARFIDELDCKEYGAYLDMGNMHAFSWTEYWVEILGKRIDKIHVKGFMRKGSINRGGTFVNITDGDINWAKAMPLLKKTGFDGYLTAEVFPDEGETWEHFYKTTYEELKSLCEMAEK